MTDKKEQFKECIELMQRDVAEFEAKYQGRFAEGPHVGLGNRKTRCVNPTFHVRLDGELFSLRNAA